MGAGALNAIVLDIGARGDGSDISVVVDCQPLAAAYERIPVDEGSLDDYLALLLLLDNPSLPHTLYPTAPLTPAELVVALRIIINSLKNAGHISFLSPLFPPAPLRLVPEKDNDGEFDVAKVLVEGKVDKLIGKAKEKKGKGKKDATEVEGDYVQVGHPYDLEATPIQIGPIRHRYLEPLFLPSLLAQLAPSHSSQAAALGFTEYEGREVLHSGVQEVMGSVGESVTDFDQRRMIWDNVIITSVGKVASNKGSSVTPARKRLRTSCTALGPALIPLLTPYCTDPESLAETQTKLLRHAKFPEYISEYKTRGGEMGVFLGGCILAKVSPSFPIFDELR